MLGILLAFGALAGLVAFAARAPADEFPEMPAEPEPEEEEELEGEALFEPFAALAGIVLEFSELLEAIPPEVALRRGDELLIRLPEPPPDGHWIFESDSPELAVGSVERPGDPSQYIQITPYSDARPTQTVVYVQQERVSTEGLRWIALEGRVDIDVLTAAQPVRFAG